MGRRRPKLINFLILRVSFPINILLLRVGGVIN